MAKQTSQETAIRNFLRASKTPQRAGEPIPRSFDKCTDPGLYISTCGCEDRVTLTGRMYFPSCIKCHKQVTWLLQRQPQA